MVETEEDTYKRRAAKGKPGVGGFSYGGFSSPVPTLVSDLGLPTPSSPSPGSTPRLNGSAGSDTARYR